MNGIELIAAERQRQIDSEGFGDDRDSQYKKGELASAAVAYAVCSYVWGHDEHRRFWPRSWDMSWWKPDNKNTIRNLEKAGALIAAEIDRLQRSRT